jgi:hypothetical protein
MRRKSESSKRRQENSTERNLSSLLKRKGLTNSGGTISSVKIMAGPMDVVDPAANPMIDPLVDPMADPMVVDPMLADPMEDPMDAVRPPQKIIEQEDDNFYFITITTFLLPIFNFPCKNEIIQKTINILTKDQYYNL